MPGDRKPEQTLCRLRRRESRPLRRRDSQKPVFSQALPGPTIRFMGGALWWQAVWRWLRGPNGPDAGCVAPWLCRGILVAAQVATVLITWPSWQRHEVPPMLPLLPVPQVDVGIPLLITLALVFLRPLVGLSLLGLLLGYAFVADQSRMLPHTISLYLLTWGTVGRPEGTLIARAALVSLWFFAGLHKLTSPEFFRETAPWLLWSIFPSADGRWAAGLGGAIGGTEVMLAVGSFLPVWRRATAIAACLFHTTTVALLSPLVMNWDPGVWPWNAALAGVSPLLLFPWQGRWLGDLWPQAARWARRGAVVLLLLPLGYWFGIVDAHFAHCLYSPNTPRAFVCTTFSRTDIRVICEQLGVQVPPAHRHFDRLFLGVGRAGEWMEVEDPRWIARLLGFDRRKVFWTDIVPSDFEVVPPPEPDVR